MPKGECYFLCKENAIITIKTSDIKIEEDAIKISQLEGITFPEVPKRTFWRRQKETSGMCQRKLQEVSKGNTNKTDYNKTEKNYTDSKYKEKRGGEKNNNLIFRFQIKIGRNI